MSLHHRLTVAIGACAGLIFGFTAVLAIVLAAKAHSPLYATVAAVCAVLALAITGLNMWRLQVEP